MAGPLEGLKILDFTTLLPGPYATMNLADMGADVLRIASGSRPDLTSLVPPFISGTPDTKISAIYAYLGRGKRSMTMNLKHPEATGIVRRLIEKYDILIEQFRPGVMARFNMDYQSLRKFSPAIIYCSLTGYGQTGPLRKKAGHDINYLARSGIMSYSGKRETGPTLMGAQIADLAAGSHNAIIGILAAVIHRNATGKGQHIDISMTDGMIAFNALAGAAYLADGNEPEREGNILNGGSLYDFYETRDGKYLSFGGVEPQFLDNFCKILRESGVLPDGTLKDKRQLREIMRKKTRDEWTKIFKDVDACVEPVLSLSEALDDEHLMERSMVADFRLPSGESVRQIANPVKFSETPSSYKGVGVKAGMHTKDVLLELGYREMEIDDFEKSGLFE